MEATPKYLVVYGFDKVIFTQPVVQRRRKIPTINKKGMHNLERKIH
jgi:hypothetical protein